MRLFVQVQLQRGLGNVDADIEDSVVVLTHTCRIRATIIFRGLSCSSNGSSLGQWANAERALPRSTQRSARTARPPAAVALRPAGRRATQLGLLSQASQVRQIEDTRT